MTDLTARFDALLAKSRQGKYVLRLYVAGSTAQSARAVQNIKALCETHLQGRYELTVVDLFQEPEQAKHGQVIAAPTLVKKLPLPLRQLIGDMSNSDRVLLALDLRPEKARGTKRSEGSEGQRA